MTVYVRQLRIDRMLWARPCTNRLLTMADLAVSVCVTIRCPSVRLSVPSIDSSSDVQLVNCCRPKRGRQIPIDSCRVPVIGRCLPPAPELWCGQRRCCDPRMIDAGLFIRRRLANSIFVVWPCCLCVGVTMPVWLIHRINNKQTTDLRFWLITTSLTNYCIIVPWLKCDCYIDCYFVQVCWTCRQTLLWVD